ncbi:acyl-CoA dehydrogenase [Streptomyces sp. N2-109]|uniref:Acyl-CoA dehydrogenase n=1 Tax=Streptomyces gossypii TaxID=2883101 RepID=A0ABT2JQM1_9ACTN|nr:acyl-CoA dehydrogenase [Streptomyces gossypii]MCT2590187.1 acyl-CoA dehydrogenase [Streptomyces gossypii]
MGLGITREQRELTEAVRGWVERAVPSGWRQELLDGVPPVAAARPPYWGELAGMGLIGPQLPEACGGGGGTLTDLAVVLEETGRALLPGPYLPTVLAAELLLRGGLAELATALAEGTRIGAVALGTGSLTATPAERGGHLLNGTAPPVLGGADADVLVLAAASAGGTLWLSVDAADLRTRTHQSADPLRSTAEVAAEDVTVPGGRVLALDSAQVDDLARTFFAAEACGVAARALETAAGHAALRVQFGQPIGAFQAVKHRCAEMAVRLDQARALTWDAARVMDEAAPVRGLVSSLAAAGALEAAYRSAQDCLQILGATGFAREHDAHLSLRRALVARQLLGGGTHLRRAARLAAGGARRPLRLELPPEAQPFRDQAREIIARAEGLDPATARRVLALTGYTEPELPEPYGLGAGPVRQLAVRKEAREAGVWISGLGVTTWAVPLLAELGTAAQRERHLPPTLRGESQWCQLFSEPDAGSDLASLRTRAERRTAEQGGGWRVNGQKAWISGAQQAHWGILLARTDPAAAGTEGLTCFLVDMRNTPGVEVRPLQDITGDAPFDEVSFEDAVLPEDAAFGQVGRGWQTAGHTPRNEPVRLPERLPFGERLESLLVHAGGAWGADASVRERLGRLLAEAHALGCMDLRGALQQIAGQETGARGIRTVVESRHLQQLAELELELLGPAGAFCEGPGEDAVRELLRSRSLTISGGTLEIRLNLIAERLLGLPRDAEPRPVI